MGKELKPFSKEMLDYPTVKNDDDGCREGFLEHVKITHIGVPDHPKNMAGWPDRNQSHHGGDEEHPAFRAKSDDGLPDFPAPFSKKNISGGPKKPGTPA